MKPRKLLNLALLSIAVIGTAAASQFSMSSRVMFGPSLNKDTLATAAGPAATPAATPAAVAPTVLKPAPPSAPPSSSTSTSINPTLPTTPAAQQQQQQQQHQLQHDQAIQQSQKPTAMERAGQLVRSVINKLDPSRPTVTVIQRDSVDLSRGTTSTIVVPPGTVVTTRSLASSSAPPPGDSSTAKPVPIMPLTATSKQERKVKEDAAKDVQQLQRGIRNDQRLNVGTTSP